MELLAVRWNGFKATRNIWNRISKKNHNNFDP